MELWCWLVAVLGGIYNIIWVELAFKVVRVRVAMRRRYQYSVLFCTNSGTLWDMFLLRHHHEHHLSLSLAGFGLYG